MASITTKVYRKIMLAVVKEYLVDSPPAHKNLSITRLLSKWSTFCKRNAKTCFSKKIIYKMMYLARQKKTLPLKY